MTVGINSADTLSYVQAESHPCEEHIIIEFETPLECLLEPEREYDQPDVFAFGIATTRKKCKTSW